MNSQTDKPFSENISFQEQNVMNKSEALTSLNSKFLDLCKKYTNKADFRMLMDNYRKCVENIGSAAVKETDSSNEELMGSEGHVCGDLSSIDNSTITNQMGSDLFDQVLCEDNSDDENARRMNQEENYFGMTVSDVDFSNKRKQDSQEKGNQSNVKNNQLNKKRREYDFNFDFERQFNKFNEEKNKGENQMTFNSQIYKFLIHFYDVNCPAYKKFQIEPEKPIKKVPHYDWPFLDVPTKPRSVFDSGPTRKEVGEYNRRIFDLITQNTFPYPRKIVYRCNPNFYDEDTPNELHKQIFKIDVEIYKYNGDAFIYNDRVTLRIYSINELKYMSLKNKQGNINMNAEIQDFKFVTEEHDKFIDVLFLQDFVIYRLLFRDRYQLESVMRLVV